MYIRVTTSGRLHLGFLDLNGGLGRLYGSIGVPVSSPKTDISVTTNRNLFIQNVGEELKKRITDFVKAFSKYYRVESNVAIQVHSSIPEHKGLGSGTQLALAVSTALARIHGIRTDAYSLSMLMGRGARSSIGIWSFERGGLIIDSGKKRVAGGVEANPPKAIMRYDFPEDWKFVVVIPKEKQGLSGEQEKKAIEFIHPSERISEEICRLVIMKLLPSLVERDIKTFGSALTDIDRQTGMFFVPVQGGIYSEKQSFGIIDHMLSAGAFGAGQSSWGPAVYGLTSKNESVELAEHTKYFLAQQKIKGSVIISSVRNSGAEIEILPSDKNYGQGKARLTPSNTDRACHVEPTA